ncbi:YdcF family protein [Pedobacter sp. HDW13]|uniref:YdcF family protein n=1 Tax=unclassified Pedobacter TaxID=2628915 RepID=UPI000F5AB1BB|nr:MULTISPECIES: YdcF family protein [unclassified Pedobacter]QIL38612.1 YdcF family protein [Pedobacter sp. HDW13]RQO78738.1 hypothetical protein DBR40_05615 [Pedobacter sp. KBW01]
MIFILSKILLYLIKPFLWFCILLILSFFAKKDKTRKHLGTAAIVVLLFFSNAFLANQVVKLYEPPYPAQKESYDVAIVLGGFSGINKRNNEIKFNGSNDRLFQTLSLYRQGRIKKILISSGNANLINNKVKEADLVKKFLHEICIPDSAVFIENQSRNTIENAKFSLALIKKSMPQAKIVVVTSAWHIPRARLIFNRQAQQKLSYYPTDFRGSTESGLNDLLIPSVSAFGTWEMLFKEWIGFLVDYFRS